GYQPTTLQQNDHGRYAYLPTFPTESIHLNDYLLLANVPGAYFFPDICTRHISTR
ncbi:unnamed protein product, partial [Rotaria magnacalcarata]